VKKQSSSTLDMHKIAVVVLFLIIAVVYARVFVRHYFLEPAHAVKIAESGLKTAIPVPGSPPPGTHFYEWSQRLNQYINTGDEQAKQWLLRDAKKQSRARHWLAIWGSLAIVCASVIIVASVGIPMLLERRAQGPRATSG